MGRAHTEPSFRGQYRVNTALEVSHARVSLYSLQNSELGYQVKSVTGR